MKRKAFGLLAMALCLCLGFSMTAMAQDPAKIWLRDGPYEVLDTEEIKAQMDIARDLAGDDKYFLTLQRLQCNDIDDTYTVVGPPGPNVIPPDFMSTGFHEASAVPTQVFDNVYYVGGMEVGGWLIDTGDGYFMLDSSYDYGAVEILIPNMLALGLDPAQVKYVLITHAGPDHVGAAKYFQDEYGTQVIYDSLIPSRPWLPNPPVATVMYDGDTLTLGDTTITMVQTPRTVGGGGFSYFIPVKIKGRPHVWATYGNTGISGGLANKAVYRESMAKFLTYVDDLGADIAISSHPFVDASLDRMELIRQCDDRRARGRDGGSKFHNRRCGRNPFLIGKEAARRYFEIMDQCVVVQIAREKAGLNNTGLEYLP